jgi:molecular chaperone GrpE
MAVAVEPSDKCENDEIIEIFQKGYKMKDKIIRPAMVKVCKK